jgi:exopolyphosphatase/guanosine-5'-triphosphate,3'-diphosphate pyrophosphatase
MTTNSNDPATPAGYDPAVGSVRQVAVIDIGTASIRMAVAEIRERDVVRPLETLTQAVDLGKDAFTRGVISKSTIEECVGVLSSYRQILEGYGIVEADRIRVVATSAVREARNRLAFVDRIYSATGFEVEPIDEAEVNRITYMSIQHLLKADPDLAEATSIIAEVGGGSTEVLLVEGADVIHAHSYRLGSLRLRELLEEFRAPMQNRRNIMAGQIDRTVRQVVEHVPQDRELQLIALGSDVRFAAAQLNLQWNRDTIARVSIDEFAAFTDRIGTLSEDELVQRYHLTYPDAETFFPALLAYLRLARALKLKDVLVANVNLRDGLLKEMAAEGAWTDEFRNQIVHSAIDLGRKFEFDEEHARRVAELCLKIFHELQDVHRLEPRYELILYLAGLLHEIGHFVSNVAHHKHSMYLISNSELFGLTRRDTLLVALVARYHRRAAPRPTHQGYASLDRDLRVAVSKMAAILRVVDAIDRSHSGRIQEIELTRQGRRLTINVPNVEDVSLEQLALEEKGTLFEDIFGMEVLLRAGGS